MSNTAKTALEASAIIQPRDVQLLDCVEIVVVCPRRDNRPSWSIPCRFRDCSMPSHTLGEGSCMGNNNVACCAMYCRSWTSSAHDGQVSRCSWASWFPPLSMMYG